MKNNLTTYPDLAVCTVESAVFEVRVISVLLQGRVEGLLIAMEAILDGTPDNLLWKKVVGAGRAQAEDLITTPAGVVLLIVEGYLVHLGHELVDL